MRPLVSDTLQWVFFTACEYNFYWQMHNQLKTHGFATGKFLANARMIVEMACAFHVAERRIK